MDIGKREGELVSIILCKAGEVIEWHNNIYMIISRGCSDPKGKSVVLLKTGATMDLIPEGKVRLHSSAYLELNH